MPTNANFWNQSSLEPKRQFRWMLYISGMPQFIVKTAKKPSFTVNESTHDFLNYKFYYPGRVTWNTVDVTIVDPIQPDSTASLVNILNAAGYVLPSDFMAEGNRSAPTTISKQAFVEAMGGQIHLVQIGANSGAQVGQNVIEKWTLNNPWLTSVDFGQLDYGSDELVNLSMTIRYDWASLELPEERLWSINAPSTVT
tara:strand:+ start:382 stop:972 length:591 start_codon:yes stop_codon:yes gene_type:complete